MANAIVGTSILVSPGRVPGAAARHSRRPVSGRVAGPATALDRALPGRRPQRGAVDRDRHLRVRASRCCRCGGSPRWRAGSRSAIIMLPIVVRTSEELVRLVPSSMREAGARAGHSGVEGHPADRAADGAGRDHHGRHGRGGPDRRARRRRCCSPRFGNRFWHQGLDQPIAALPLQIYAYAISPYDDWHRQAWAGALVLIGMVFVVSLAARVATRGAIYGVR